MTIGTRSGAGMSSGTSDHDARCSCIAPSVSSCRRASAARSSSASRTDDIQEAREGKPRSPRDFFLRTHSRSLFICGRGSFSSTPHRLRVLTFNTIRQYSRKTHGNGLQKPAGKRSAHLCALAERQLTVKPCLGGSRARAQPRPAVAARRMRITGSPSFYCSTTDMAMAMAYPCAL